MRALPYSRHFQESGPGGVVLYLGSQEGWQAAKNNIEIGASDVLLLPAGESPDQYRWPFLVGRSVVIVDYTGVTSEYGRTVARHLLNVGATEVLWANPADDVLFVAEGVA